jgi:PadR family transcriptional regulator, regulatory protein AphA
MTRLSSVGKVILGALHGGPRSGYEIKRLVDHSTRFFWAASYGQIYPELRRLEADGLVVGASEPRGGRARRVYRLTPAGADALTAWLTDDGMEHALRDEALLKLFFADALPPGHAVGVVRAMRKEREARLARLREIEASLPPGADGFRVLVLRYGIEFHEWMVDWCGEIERRCRDRATGEVEEASAR